MKAVPTWEELNRFVLKALISGQTLSLQELRDTVCELAGVDAEQRAVTYSSGQFTVNSRISWSASYLTRVEALERPGRGQYQITQQGRALLLSHDDCITEKDLREMAKPDDRWWLPRKATGTLKGAPGSDAATDSSETRLDPTEQIEEGILRINDEVASSLLTRLQTSKPEFFEKTVVDLLIAMGYGGAHGKGTVTGLSNDNGVDGVIDQDALGLNKIYIQAKRYSSSNSVQRPEVQGFVGALSGKADGGLFITTGKFTKGATEYAGDVPARIILIDGQQLVELMIRYGVGVEVKQTYHVVGIDEDFFA